MPCPSVRRDGCLCARPAHIGFFRATLYAECKVSIETDCEHTSAKDVSAVQCLERAIAVRQKFHHFARLATQILQLQKVEEGQQDKHSQGPILWLRPLAAYQWAEGRPSEQRPEAVE
jgi:hypothetical protein